ncbi:hypothetical protein SEVIR_9G208300v4 [Setaria viridis]|uniref:Uncharacterized protein n=1 Tax=Setaria viridis TaxID=4556 RepID=A0A4U6SWI4_SETVI|nr:uncharacterized protein LOC117840458 [Setaria viridis]TKV93170.1 hypothetical protein SEVIR_9G208300v2 [Setaria viridis]
MKLLRIAAVASLLLALAATAGAIVTIDVTNTASNTLGGQRFDREVGLDFPRQIISEASMFIWMTFNQTNPADRKPVDAIALVVADVGGVAFTSNDVITLSAQYIGNYSGNVRIEVASVLFHETTHVWQWDGQGQASRGLIEGIADYIVYRAGYRPAYWVQQGQGERWDEGYSVTAMFLVYCDTLRPGFVALLNAKMRYGYTDDLFAQILGKDVQQLWQDYKAMYGA